MRRRGRHVDLHRFTAEEVGLMYRVPVWLLDGSQRPRWRDRPFYRARALWWLVTPRRRAHD